MYGRVVNKKARHNLCFSDIDQVADYEHGKGTIINFIRTPLLQHIRNNLGDESIFDNYTTINHLNENNSYSIITDYYNGNTIRSCKINDVYQVEKLNNGFK